MRLSAHGHEWLEKLEGFHPELSDIRDAEEAVNRYVTVELTQSQFDTLVSFTFNVGAGAFEESTLLRLLNDGFLDAVPNELVR